MPMSSVSTSKNDNKTSLFRMYNIDTMIEPMTGIDNAKNRNPLTEPFSSTKCGKNRVIL